MQINKMFEHLTKVLAVAIVITLRKNTARVRLFCKANGP